jgi:hypothetical protein
MADLLSQTLDGKLGLQTPETILGIEWNRPDSGWQRTVFTRTSDSLRNEKGQKCHAVVGLGYEYDSQTYDWILGDARQLLLDGYLTFAPFIRSSPGLESLGERLQKAKMPRSELDPLNKT